MCIDMCIDMCVATRSHIQINMCSCAMCCPSRGQTTPTASTGCKVASMQENLMSVHACTCTHRLGCGVIIAVVDVLAVW